MRDVRLADKNRPQVRGYIYYTQIFYILFEIISFRIMVFWRRMSNVSLYLPFWFVKMRRRVLKERKKERKKEIMKKQKATVGHIQSAVYP
jgi:hypothetical protein